PKVFIDAIDPDKDADAFHTLDAGHLTVGNGNILPCTPAGIVELLRRYCVPVAGREAVVIGRSDIVGRPAAAMLLALDATVTIAHSRTRDLASVVRRGDIVVSTVGRAGLITGDMLKPGCALIDVGMNRDSEGILCGDADFASCEKVAGYITPVPGGVGPMTVAMLMRNTMNAALKRESVC
ncbi:MAG: bifunctional 5,10-methylenetetrahydrofolate dehydrogenase/5,10-methenyltetrahydrofolate cyclohydrolase, partial [Clostridia bacterium]|nr:bifunctional 5,10-methylenetetrahydrofolate dehydrogenase/5,10-methenyltetrahydrofolate cyclohydrolase [Clostridia bacterium]